MADTTNALDIIKKPKFCMLIAPHRLFDVQRGTTHLL